MDVHDSATRSKNMSAIKSKNTRPELIIRKLLHHNGFRFRVTPSYLPSKPDVWMAKWNTVIWIHGCFWHKHDCRQFRPPKSHTEFWEDKLSRNIERDTRNKRELFNLGIRLLIIWECAITGKQRLSEQILLQLIKTFLATSYAMAEIDDSGLKIM